MEIGKCPKCNGTGRIRDRDGIHVCFDCLNKGKFDQAEEKISNEKPILRKLDKFKPNNSKSNSF